MKPAHDPNRQQSTTTPARTISGAVVRPVTAVQSASITVPTTNTGHIITTPTLQTIKTLPVTTTRVGIVPHTTTLTLVGSTPTNIRPVATTATSYQVSKVQTTPNVGGQQKSAVGNPIVRGIVTTGPVASPAGTATFVSGIRALTKPIVTAGSQWSNTTKLTVATPSKVTTTPVAASFQPVPRAAASVTVTARPVVTAARPELATLRTTKTTGPTPEKFIRHPSVALTFAKSATVPAGGQFSTQTHLALPLAQSSSTGGTALTLQPIIVGTAAAPCTTIKTTPTGATAARHQPINSKVLTTQPTHGQIITHVTGIKPGATATPRGPAPQIHSGAAAFSPSGTQVKVVTQTPILTDVLTPSGMIPGSVYIQTTQHPSATGNTPIIRTFTPSPAITPANVQVQQQQQAVESHRKSAFASNVTSSGTLARFTPVPGIDRIEASSSEITQQSTVVSSSGTSSSHPVPITTAQTISISSQQSVSAAPSTPTSTPSKFISSPRPSILRKRDHEGTPSKVQKNLGPVLAALTREMPPCSPPPSPPQRPDSRDGKDGNERTSSAGSSTISATSSPGIPDTDNVIPTIKIDQDVDTCSNNGTNGEAMSPRKKPRKQQLTGNELQEAPYSEEPSDFNEDMKDRNDGNQKSSQNVPNTSNTPAKSSSRNKTNLSLLRSYNYEVWGPRLHHYIRPTDVRPREERRPTIAELSSQKRVVQRAHGWKFHYITTQVEYNAEVESEAMQNLEVVLQLLEKNKADYTGAGKDNNKTCELIKSNIQRNKVVRDQLEESGTSLIRLLDHKTRVVDLIKRNANRRQAKKKY